MEKKEIRLLEAGEIECRVGSIGAEGLSLLLYKNSRVDMRILDEVYGSFGWQRTHQCIDGNLYCTIQLWDSEKGQWISKQDVGTASYAEQEKGQASDSFKRACVSVGIGRELYTAPFIWIPADKCRIESKNGRFTTKDRFSVHTIAYNDNREITELSIINKSGEIVYSTNKAALRGNNRQNGFISGAGMKRVNKMNRELERTGIAIDTVLNHYHVSSVEEMSSDTFDHAMKKLSKTESRAA